MVNLVHNLSVTMIMVHFINRSNQFFNLGNVSGMDIVMVLTFNIINRALELYHFVL